MSSMPAVRLYRSLQRMLAPGAEIMLPTQLEALLDGWRPTGPSLDVGCGDASMLTRLGIGPVIGLDIAHDRLIAFAHAAQRTATDDVALHADATRLPLREGSVGLAFCCGLLHHLPDAAVLQTLDEMTRVLAPGGRIVVFDAVLPECPAFRPLAAAIRTMDRGRFMRSQSTLQTLIHTAQPKLDWQMQRVSYAGSGLEGLWCFALTRSRC